MHLNFKDLKTSKNTRNVKISKLMSDRESYKESILNQDINKKICQSNKNSNKETLNQYTMPIKELKIEENNLKLPVDIKEFELNPLFYDLGHKGFKLITKSLLPSHYQYKKAIKSESELIYPDRYTKKIKENDLISFSINKECIKRKNFVHNSCKDFYMKNNLFLMSITSRMKQYNRNNIFNDKNYIEEYKLKSKINPFDKKGINNNYSMNFDDLVSIKSIGSN